MSSPSSMSNDVFVDDSSTSDDESQCFEEQDWSQLIEKLHFFTGTLLLRICEINDDIDRKVTDIRVDDEIVLHDVVVDNVRITPEEDFEDPDKPNSKSINIAAASGGKYRLCPHFIPTHTFHSVQEILNIFPFVTDLIFPGESFTVEGLEIPAWDPLYVVDKVESSSDQSLRVTVVKKQTTILLPAALNVTFLQWNEHFSLQDAKTLERFDPRLYSLSQLCEIWSKKFHPMTVKIHNERNCTRPKCVHETSKSPNSLKKLFGGKKSKPVSSPALTISPSSEFFMIPETWHTKRLVVEPLHTAKVTISSTGKKFNLPSHLKLKVKQIRVDKPKPAELRMNGGSVLRSPHRRSCGTSLPLHQIKLSQLERGKNRSNAIVAVVTESLTTGSRLSDSLAMGTKIAIHRVRRVRKMLLRSQDSQHYLVSSYYAGEFKRLPLVFDLAGDVPIKCNTPYITRCTAYPVQKQLDSCHEGKYVWFLKQTEIPLNDTPTPTKVVQCSVSDSLDGTQRSVNFPLNLRGRFERVDESPTEITTRELHKKDLPVCIKVEKPDPSIGYDPLAMKRHFQAVKCVTDQTVVVEILKKSKENGSLISSGKMRELPLKRCSLFVREIPTKAMDPIRGIDPYPIKNDFKGIGKLPCVEMLAQSDVDQLEVAIRSISSISSLSQSFDGPNISPVHSSNNSFRSSNNSCDRRKEADASPTIPEHNVPHLGERKSRSVEDLTEASRDATNIEKPEIPQKLRRQTALPNYEHAEDLSSNTAGPQTNYEHAEDLSLDREPTSNYQTNGFGKPKPKLKPKPKPRRQTLPGSVVVNTDEFILREIEDSPFSNDVSHNQSGSKNSKPFVKSFSTVHPQENHTAVLKTQTSTSSQKDYDSDYEEVVPSSGTDDYEDVVEELEDLAPQLPPRPNSLDFKSSLVLHYPVVPPRPDNLV